MIPNWQKLNILWIFDVDGVLTNMGDVIDPEFQAWFVDWSKDKKYWLVTGSPREKVIEQIGTTIVENADIGFYCLGNSIWMDENKSLINQFILKQEEIDWLNNAVTQSNFPIKTGDHIQCREGSVNFSVIGRSATKEARLEYQMWDAKTSERINIIKSLTETFPRLSAFIGGRVSIDICMRSCDKFQILNYVKSDSYVIFLGDRCFEYGVDAPLAGSIRRRGFMVYEIINGYLDSWNILKEYVIHSSPRPV